MNYEEIIKVFKQLLRTGATPKDLLIVAANARRAQIERELFNHFNGVIQDGIFKGVKLSPTPHDSVLTPKILGTYEIEIANYVKQLAEQSRVFIDIGCADGYYTTGIAVNTCVEKVVGVDTSSQALEIATSSAKENKIIKKCVFENKLTNALSHLESGCFVMIDVDGSEIEVLNELSGYVKASKLRKINILLETDFDTNNQSNKHALVERMIQLDFTISKIVDCNPLCPSRFSPIARRIYLDYLDQMVCALERANSNQSWIIATTALALKQRLREQN